MAEVVLVVLVTAPLFPLSFLHFRQSLPTDAKSPGSRRRTPCDMLDPRTSPTHIAENTTPNPRNPNSFTGGDVSLALAKLDIIAYWQLFSAMADRVGIGSLLQELLSQVSIFLAAKKQLRVLLWIGGVRECASEA